MTVRLPVELALRCSGCGEVVDDPTVAACPSRRLGDDIDHRLEVPVVATPWPSELARDHPNPFVAYRTLGYSHRVALVLGLSDDDYVSLVEELDAAVTAVDGRGFRRTELREQPELARACGFGPGTRLWVKDETGNVSGSHKARHLMGLMIHQRVLEAAGVADATAATPLAIASCGNAALGAAVVARAANRSLRVFVPEWLGEPTFARLRALGADVQRCERRTGEVGDPCYLRMRQAVAAGAVAFATQGSENALTLEGGATMGYELVDSLARLDALFVQVGGGALGASLVLGLRRAAASAKIRRLPSLWAVQAEQAHPLQRALRRTIALTLAELGDGRPVPILVGEALARLASRRHEAMLPWPSEPHSIATGILDDEVYDWRPLVEAALTTSGGLALVSEKQLARANELARHHTGIDVDPTGSAGLAGALTRAGRGQLEAGNLVVLFTGVVRD